MTLRNVLYLTALCVPFAPTFVPEARAADGVANVAHIKLSGDLDEAPVAFDPFFGGSAENFRSKIDHIKKAKNDKDIQALYLQIDGVAIGWAKLNELRKAIGDFRASGKKAFDEFKHVYAIWLEDYSLFRALKDANGGKSWQDWSAALVRREPAAVETARRETADVAGMYKFGQFLFFQQWRDIKKYANDRGVRLIGDVPIFVSSDSADVWANPNLFQLDEQRRPRFVAGVPPDYFSRTGQLWGNPLYDWEALRRTDYAWWVARLQATLAQVDLIRIDHFRGFESYWEIPAGMPTAEVGRWVKGPGDEFFHALRRHLGSLPLIAEDLGIITDEVGLLRDRLQLPGMRILQFAFGGAVEDRFLPHNYERNTVVYTGTHDNDTTRGWYAALGDKERDFARRYVGRDGTGISWDLIRLAWSSIADYAVAPLQDLLDLGTDARMNMPGQAIGNWGWRFQAEMVTDALFDRLRDLTEVYGR